MRRLAIVIALVVGALVLGAILAFLALAAGDDRLVPCQSLGGLDAQLGDEVNHVDGGATSGDGCIVPTAGAWTVALIGLFAPIVLLMAWGVWRWSRNGAQSHPASSQVD